MRRSGETNLSFIDPVDRSVRVPARLGDAAGHRSKWHGQHRMAELRRRSRPTRDTRPRSDQREQLQESRNRLALQDRQPRSASRIQPRVDTADGQRRALLDRRHAACRRCARRRHRRAAVDAQRERRARAAQRAAPAFRPRVSPTGPTAARNASSTSRPAIG